MFWDLGYFLAQSVAVNPPVTGCLWSVIFHWRRLFDPVIYFLSVPFFQIRNSCSVMSVKCSVCQNLFFKCFHLPSTLLKKAKMLSIIFFVILKFRKRKKILMWYFISWKSEGLYVSEKIRKLHSHVLSQTLLECRFVPLSQVICSCKLQSTITDRYLEACSMRWIKSWQSVLISSVESLLCFQVQWVYNFNLFI